MKYKDLRARRRRPASWAGFLLGFLLTLFLATFLYVGFMFVSWGRSALAAVPELPDLSLPRLVRAAPSGPAVDNNQAGVPWQMSGAQADSQEAAPQQRVTVLIMGVDNRPDEHVEATRTDTIMVLTVDPQINSAGMLSIPRDLLAYVPALNREAKINTVHVLGYSNGYPGGGPALLKDTVSELIGYPIDYYVRLNFDGFSQIIDQIGGVEIDVPQAIDDPLYPDNNYGYDPLYIPAGRQHMDGTLALKYSRTRHGSSDYGRAARQQQVILAIKDKLTQPGQLASLLPRIPGLALALSNSVQTDMPVDQAITLARALDKTDLKNPARVVIDDKMGVQVPDDPTFGFILKVTPAQIHAAAATIFADQPVASAEEALRKAVKSEGARVIVLNGSAEEGLAAKTAAILSGEGYNVVAIGNAPEGDNPQTSLITYGDGFAVTREALLRRFNIPSGRINFEPGSPDADLAVVLGADAVPVPAILQR
jgi:LCP family protein required for cell wall assembly